MSDTLRYRVPFLTFIMTFVFAASTALAIDVLPLMSNGDDHGDLSPECRALQILVQDSVGDEDPAVYRNHGAYVSTAAKMVSPYLESGMISEECASCIINQFARRIPIAEQENCGEISPNPECEAAACGTFVPCNEPTSCPSPVCAAVAEGGGVCVEGSTSCGGLQACPGGTADCTEEGALCVVDTCCGGPVCVPPSTFCEQDGAPGGTAPVVPSEGPTLGDFSSKKPGDVPQSWGTIKASFNEND